ncbi:CDP-alcohol phosphatidyltransferase family protein [Acinetobacter soli]|uniref:CDP-alcohol phosphatidyltransferase family protein n=1 Tax=Acinetobacter soli TaxID=487316 RepID=A0AB38YU21_9GAMM|nr:CDP-alcohol phosphatidyltransferase family protein [Acinetobacter soli]KQC98151.1 CDP-alcohol phosphatidyltransferase [Acinetobacter soli]MDQ8943680.1 CDP-alcohol phosphatidyltransferase family protein [Acinetobacter soli]WEH92884.1 CDP-alcohol phosphatidyltransferase family protein [Acinetobacter soli]WEH97928.1 CDP-alcohol phosphatidyltransferase family protein [Acinetobacter soli]WEI01499.1 CDP-alcohol phosphatidyltransferase family protein [Acinetobacter soli]
MPSIYQLKPAFQNLLRPLVKQLYYKGVTANQVTVLAMLISVALAAYLLLHENIAPYLIWLFIPLWMLVRMGFNAIDGMLAREFNQQTMLGAYLNELCDVISDTVLYGCFIAFGFIEPILLVAVIFMAILSEYAGVMAPLIGQARRYDGPMGKSDRAFCFSLLALWIVLASKLNSIISEQILHSVANGLLGIMALLLMLTISNRVRHAIHSK